MVVILFQFWNQKILSSFENLKFTVHHPNTIKIDSKYDKSKNFTDINHLNKILVPPTPLRGDAQHLSGPATIFGRSYPSLKLIQKALFIQQNLLLKMERSATPPKNNLEVYNNLVPGEVGQKDLVRVI